MASMPSKVQTLNFSANFALPHFKVAPNTTSPAAVTAPCAKWTLMGWATFLASHPSHFITLGLKIDCVVPESKKHNTQLNPILNLSMVKLGPNLATLAFATNPSCA